MSHLDHVAPPSAPHGRRTVDLQWFRIELEQQRRFRLDQLTDLSYEATVASDDAQGEVTSALMTAARTVLAEIDAALFRLAIGSYGVCQQCNRAIPTDRLEAIPMASLCLPCQYSRESQSPQTDPGTVKSLRTTTTPQVPPSLLHRNPAAPDIVDVWGTDSFPASDPPANW
jgi:RNA polymerase-binding transcription factor DksA